MSGADEEELDFTAMVKALFDVLQENLKSARETSPIKLDKEYVQDIVARFVQGGTYTKDGTALLKAVWYLTKGFHYIQQAGLTENSPYSFCGINEYLLSAYHIQAFQSLTLVFSNVPMHFVAEAFFENGRLFIPAAIAIEENLGVDNTWKGVPFRPVAQTEVTLPAMHDLHPHLKADIDIFTSYDTNKDKSDLATYYDMFCKQKRVVLTYPPPPVLPTLSSNEKIFEKGNSK